MFVRKTDGSRLIRKNKRSKEQKWRVRKINPVWWRCANACVSLCVCVVVVNFMRNIFNFVTLTSTLCKLQRQFVCSAPRRRCKTAGSPEPGETRTRMTRSELQTTVHVDAAGWVLDFLLLSLRVVTGFYQDNEANWTISETIPVLVRLELALDSSELC